MGLGVGEGRDSELGRRQAQGISRSAEGPWEDCVRDGAGGPTLILYLDTSSLIKLYVEEEGSTAVREQVAGAAVVVTSTLAYPEARSALARLRRDGGLSDAEQARAKADFDRDWSGFLTLPVEKVWRQAGDLAERHGLRGADSIHLASFLALIGMAQSPVRFSSSDSRLNLAAQREAGES
ncbi:MAG TPA: type II toxin-antitoxin system VapC family toxin [Thermoanaerobaculia bacterium]|nr:type II toxin-antitoxin system VapC family toxin [Thermoanaerobaculia bacterium]